MCTVLNQRCFVVANWLVGPSLLFFSYLLARRYSVMCYATVHRLNAGKWTNICWNVIYKYMCVPCANILDLELECLHRRSVRKCRNINLKWTFFVRINKFWRTRWCDSNGKRYSKFLWNRRKYQTRSELLNEFLAWNPFTWVKYTTSSQQCNL